MNAKTKSVVIGVSVSVAVLAIGLGVGLGVGLHKKPAVHTDVHVKGSVLKQEQLPLAPYVSKNDAYLVQDGADSSNITLYVASQDSPTSLSHYQVLKQDKWPIPPPSSSKDRSSCFGGKEAKNQCTVAYAGEFAKNKCTESMCEWGYKCRLDTTLCTPAYDGSFSTGTDCTQGTPCGWLYKCVNNACVLAPDGTFNSFADCRANCA